MQTDLMLKPIIKAIEKAHIDYEEMSGDWLWSGAEYFLTVYIAKHLKKKKEISRWVAIETPVESGYLIFRPGPRNADLRSGGRFDITLWDADSIITDVIEVKSSVSPSTCRSDFRRLASVVTRSNSARGWFAYYDSYEGVTDDAVNEWLATRAKALEVAARKVGNEYGIKVDTMHKISAHKIYEGKPSAALFMSIGFERG